MKYFDAFSGIGGFSEGIHRTCPDWECVGNSDIDKYANSIYANHFKEVKQYGDITKVDKLPEGTDMLCCGFPCQSFSIAGKRRGFEDTRGTMFFEIARLCKASKPKYLVLENVKGLLNHDKGETFRVIIQTLDELGYDAEWRVLNSKNFGVPQNRERVFIVCHLRGIPFGQVFPVGENDSETDKSDKEGGNAIIVKGMLSEDGWDKRHENIRRVYGSEGISPTIPTVTRGGHMTKIMVNEIQTKVSVRKNKVDIEGLKALLRNSKSMSNKEIAEKLGVPMTMVEHWFRTDDCFSIPDAELWTRLKEILGIKTGEFDAQIMEFEERDGVFEKGNRAYDVEGLAPTLTRTEKGEKIIATYRHSFKDFKGYEDCSPSIKSSEGSGNQIIINKIRRLTPKECERLQGFPDDWTRYGADGKEISDTKRYKMCGNAVTVNVIEYVMKRLFKAMGLEVGK